MCPRSGRGGDGTKITPPGDMFDQPPGKMSSIRGKLADYVGDLFFFFFFFHLSYSR